MMSEFNGEKCFEKLCGIWENDRFGDFSHFEKTSEVVAGYLKDAGCVEVERLGLKADGETRYGDWTMPRAWDLKKGALSFESGEILCSTDETPLCVAMFSAAVEKRTFDAVWAEKSDETAWAGKIVYTQNPPKLLVKKALEVGAAGIISDFFPVYSGVREEDDAMDGVSRWENDLFYPKNPSDLFGFMLSRAGGRKIRAAFDRGEDVRLTAEIDAVSYAGRNYVVSGLIPADGIDGEIMLCGHLYEPGANDNATGCAMLCTLAETLASSLKAPHRGIRFVMGYEAAGMSGYAAAHADRLKKTVAALNCDMVGAADAEKAVMKIWNSNLTTPDFSFALLQKTARELAVPFETSPFDIGDCLVADPAIGVPCCSLVMHPARSYHSSMDTPELVDVGTLEKSGKLAKRWAEALAAPEDSDIEQIKQLFDEDYDKLLQNTSDPAFGLKVEAAQKAYEAFEKWAYREPVPIRTFAGPATLAGRMRFEDPGIDPFYNVVCNTLLFHADGKRTLHSVIRRACLELDMKLTPENDAKFRKFFNELDRAGLVIWEKE